MSALRRCDETRGRTRRLREIHPADLVDMHRVQAFALLPGVDTPADPSTPRCLVRMCSASHNSPLVQRTNALAVESSLLGRNPPVPEHVVVDEGSA